MIVHVVLLCVLQAEGTHLAIASDGNSSQLPLAEREINMQEDDQMAKILEGYVLAANFDGNPGVASNQSLSVGEVKEPPAIRISNDGHLIRFQEESNDLTKEVEVDDRHGVVPGPSRVSHGSILAVGFIAFLILLTNLQNGLVNMIVARPSPAANQQTSLLGGVTQALGRRRRSYNSYRAH